MQLADILKDSEYKLSQFEPEDLDWLEDSIFLKTVKKVEKPYIKCLIRNKDIQLKPEEIVRQLYLKVLIGRYGYPSDRIIVEYPVKFGTETKKADIAIMDVDRPTVPYVIVELKKPKEKAGKDQLKSYCNATGAPIGVWTNGDSISRWHRKDPNYFERITDIPKASQTLEDILQIKFTLEDLIQNDRLVNEKMSLRALIEEMEDEVLANAGVDVFEEVFKLIFTKLYDEWLSGQGSNRNKRILEFRNTGQTETALKNKIQDLFDRAKEKWEGVFSEDSKITLTPSHLSVCVRSLENVKLFNSNLDVIDEAFEYLVNQSSKGEKGQYFTPRYVIDMCVKMLNPQEDEYMIDTAAGSSGFPVHTIFHVWKQILEDEGIEASHLFTIEEKPHRCTEYVEKRVFAIDFDEKSVRVARTLNLIAGDGQTNVMRLNTLDYDGWDEITKEESWNDTYNDGFKRLKKLRKNSNSYKEFEFDVLMANPPFAGDIKEGRIIHKYALSKKPNGKWQTKVGRDILFIERNLDFLKPGGRMAIVLPQGRFNNSSDKQIREFIAERCRILAVVGLHGNTFKPHTGTKTSVLLVQKWNDDPRAGALCPRQDDYNIFFATMQKSGKDNSGEKIYRRIVPPDEEMSSARDKERDLLLDEHQHLVIDHDLFNHEGLTEDGIAEAFMEFVKKEKLSFFEQSPFVTPFSKDKYERLMDGLEASEVLLSETLKNKDFRVDSEFHRKPPLKNQKYEYVDIGKHLTLVQYGISIEMNEEGEGTKIYRMNEIHNMLCDIDVLKSAKISSIEIEKYKLKERDILFNRTNSFDLVGRTGLFKISSDREFVFASYLIRVRTDESKILPEYLVAFLNSNLGIWDIKRRARISINQSNVNSQELAAVKIPLLNREFQLKLKEIFDRAHLKRLESIKTYQEAEDLLLSELGLKDWEPTEETVAVKRFSESFLLGDARLDAEYYQPKYDQAELAIQNCGFSVEPLGMLIEPIQNGFDYREYTEEGTPYIRVGDIKNGQINYDSAVKIPITMDDVAKSVGLHTGDILFTRKGSFGNSAVVTENEVDAIISSEIMLVRINEEYKSKLCPEYVSLFLNSKFGYLQVERRVHGVAYYSISQPDLAAIKIPLLPTASQNKIVQFIKSSFHSKAQSKQLLEIAKHGVEKAIETDEKTAIHWINQELEKLKIKLPSLT